MFRLPNCPQCSARIGEHHAATCKHWGQVLPSEVPGYIEETAREVLQKKVDAVWARVVADRLKPK